MIDSLKLRKIAPMSGLVTLAAAANRHRFTAAVLFGFLCLFVSNYFCLPSPALMQTKEEKDALAEAERLKKVLGPDHPDVAASLNNLAALYRAQGDYAKAEPLYQRSLAIREKVLGADHPDVAASLNNLGRLYYDQGQYDKAEPRFQRSLAILEKIVGADHPNVATNLNNLAELYRTQGQYAKAEPLYQRSLAIREKVLGAEHRENVREKLRTDVARSLNNLAELYRNQGQYAKAEQLFQRSLAMRKKALGAEHPEVAASFNNLATLYWDQREYAKAEPFYRRSLLIWEKVLGPEHPEVASGLNNLASLHHDQGDYHRAEPLYHRSLAIREKAFGADHPDVALTLNNLAELYREQGQYAKAEPLFRRSLAIGEKVWGAQHPDVAASLNNLAFLYEKQAQFLSARSFYERARQARLGSLRSNADIDDEAQTALSRQARGSLLRYASLLATISRSRQLEDNPGSAQRDAFMVLEQVRSGLAQAALVKSSLRAAAENPATSALARAVQDLRYRRQNLSKRLHAEYAEVIAQRNNELVENLQKERGKLDNELKAAVEKLNKVFPKYAELAGPDPITIDEVEKLLGPDEAMVSFFTLDDRLLAWLVRKDKAYLYREKEIKKQDLHRLVTQVLFTLDQLKYNGDLVQNSLTPFDVRTSFDLYKLLLLPFKEQLGGVNNLIIVPDEVLLPIPFGALITNNEGDSFKILSELYTQWAEDEKRNRRGETIHFNDRKLLEYTKLPWLIKDYTLTILPSATSLRALRQIPRTKQKQTELLIAFGDPALGGGGAKRGGAMLASRGTFVPVEEIRKLGGLPGTKAELEAIAKALGANRKNSLYLGENATEPTVTKLNTSGRLAKAEVVAFSTHGLISGDLKGRLKEPALVLTPPKVPTEEDDGLLGLEDILKLKLDSADWVILSACNTGSADGSGEGLSGLTRAFFFAGARSLLVSHWSVDDRATQNLMTEIFQRYAKNKNIPKAEALRQGMLSLLQTQNWTYFAHPFAWAPFFVVGDR